MPANKSIFVSASDDIKVWSAESMQILKQYNYHESNIKDVAWNHDNTVLASTSVSGDSIVLCDTQIKHNEKPEVINQLATKEQQTSVCFGSNGKLIFSGGSSGDVNAWDCYTGKRKKNFSGCHPSPVTCLAINSSDTQLASACTAGEITLWLPGSGMPFGTLKDLNGQAIRGLEYSPWIDLQFGTASDDGGVRIWDANKQVVKHAFKDAHLAPAMDLSYSTLNHLLLGSCGLDKNFILYDMSRKELVRKVHADHPLTSMCFMADGMYICAGSSLGTLYKFDLRKTNPPISIIQAHSTSIQRLVLNNIAKSVLVDKDKSRRSRSSKSTTSNTSPDVVKTRQPASTATIDTQKQPKQNGEDKSDLEKVKKKSNSKSPKTSVASEKNPIRSSSTKRIIDTEFGKADVSMKFEHGPDALAQINPVMNTPGTRSNHSSFRDTLGSYCEGVFSPVAQEFRGDTPGISIQENGESFFSQPSSRENLKSDKKANSPADKFFNGHQEPSQRGSYYLSPGAIKNTQQNKNNDPPGKLGSSLKVSSNSRMFSNTRQSHPPSPLATNSYDRQISDAVTYKTISQSSHSDSESLQESPPRASANYSPANSEKSDKAESKTEDSSGKTTTSNMLDPYQYQLDFLKNTVRHLIEEHEDNVLDEVRHVHLQMIKMVLGLEQKMEKLAEQCSVNPLLLQEIERLRLENDKLRRRY